MFHSNESLKADPPVNSIVNLNVPSSNGVSAGPKITAFHKSILLSVGAPETPAGGSSWSLLKSLINRLLADVDMIWGYKIYLNYFVKISISGYK